MFESITSQDLKTPAEKTLLGHVCWICEALKKRLITKIQWCDTWDMLADGHTKGTVDRNGLLEAMGGRQTFMYTENLKPYEPYRGNSIGDGTFLTSTSSSDLSEEWAFISLFSSLQQVGFDGAHEA